VNSLIWRRGWTAHECPAPAFTATEVSAVCSAPSWAVKVERADRHSGGNAWRAGWEHAVNGHHPERDSSGSSRHWAEYDDEGQLVLRGQGWPFAPTADDLAAWQCAVDTVVARGPEGRSAIRSAAEGFETYYHVVDTSYGEGEPIFTLHDLWDMGEAPAFKWECEPGDTRSVLRGIPPASADCCITSPQEKSDESA